MKEHTPGPWTLGEDGSIDTDRGAVAFVHPYSYIPTAIREGEEFSHADGHLIATAPDLLAACRAIVAAFDAWDHGPHSPLIDHVGYDLIDAARSAIAKATGEGS